MIFVLRCYQKTRELYKRRDLIGWRVFERSGGKKRTTWPSPEGGFFWSSFSFGFSLTQQISSFWKNQLCLSQHLLDLLTISFAPHRFSPKELKEVCVVICCSLYLILVVSDSLQFLFFPRIYQIRITTRRMQKEMARCRERSCSTETRHSENHGTVKPFSCQFSLT